VTRIALREGKTFARTLRIAGDAGSTVEATTINSVVSALAITARKTCTFEMNGRAHRRRVAQIHSETLSSVATVGDKRHFRCSARWGRDCAGDRSGATRLRQLALICTAVVVVAITIVAFFAGGNIKQAVTANFYRQTI
jgi:hypothetical protein